MGSFFEKSLNKVTIAVAPFPRILGKVSILLPRTGNCLCPLILLKLAACNDCWTTRFEFGSRRALLSDRRSSTNPFQWILTTSEYHQKTVWPYG